MTKIPPSKVLLLGATGYIGGTILNHLLQSRDPLLGNTIISVLVRGEDRAAKLKHAFGARVQPIPFSGLDDTAQVARAASEHDIVLNAAQGFHTASAVALVDGLGKRLATAPRRPWMIHLSGVSNVADSPLVGNDHPDRRFDDADPRAIYNHEKREEAAAGPYPQRAAELAVLDGADASGVGALSIQAPALFGPGGGLFSVTPSHLALMFRFLVEKGYAFQLGDGSGCIGVGHVDDLAALFVLLVEKILADGGDGLPLGKEGILYAQVGTVTGIDVAKGCLDATFRSGALPHANGPAQKELRTISLDEAAPIFGGGATGKFIASKCWAGRSNTTATVAKKFGWKPVHGADEWWTDSHFDQELAAFLAGKRDVLAGDSLAAQESY